MKRKWSTLQSKMVNNHIQSVCTKKIYTVSSFVLYFSFISSGLNSDPILLWKVTPKPEMAPRLVILQFFYSYVCSTLS